MWVRNSLRRRTGQPQADELGWISSHSLIVTIDRADRGIQDVSAMAGVLWLLDDAAPLV